MPSPADTAAFQGVLTQLAAAAVAATTMVDYPDAVDPYLAASGVLAAQWYHELAPTAGYAVQIAPNPPKDVLYASARWAATQSDPVQALGLSTERRVFNQSRDTVALNARREGVKYARHASANACPWCRVLASRGAVYRDEKSGAASHDGCVIAGTAVSGPFVESAFRRRYEGEVVIISMADGQDLTITPNHPVLTEKGWIPAGLLQGGHNIVRTRGCDAGAFAVPDEHQQPALIEDVWRALAMNGFTRMPITAENFHGDGLDGEVQIVGADRDLDAWAQTLLLEHLQELAFTAASGNRPRSSFAGLSERAAFLPRTDTSTGSRMGGGSQFGTLFRSCAIHSDAIRGSRGPRFNAQFEKTPTNDDTSCVKSLSDFKFRQFFIDIEAHDGVGVDINSGGSRFDPAGLQFTTENRSAYARLGLDLLTRLAGHVEIDSILDCRRIEFSGHVYNLQTEQGWYAADTAIVSNCHCITVPVREGDTYQPPDYVAGWLREYADARDKVGGNLDNIVNYLRAKS